MSYSEDILKENVASFLKEYGLTSDYPLIKGIQNIIKNWLGNSEINIDDIHNMSRAIFTLMSKTSYTLPDGTLNNKLKNLINQYKIS